MAPLSESHVATAVHDFARRDLSVNNSQAVTLGIIAVYVVVIALLWNIPYVRNVLWPFKASLPRIEAFPWHQADHQHRCSPLLSMNLVMRSLQSSQAARLKASLLIPMKAVSRICEAASRRSRCQQGILDHPSLAHFSSLPALTSLLRRWQASYLAPAFS